MSIRLLLVPLKPQEFVQQSLIEYRQCGQGSIPCYMLHSPERDSMVETVIDVLRRVGWVRGYVFETGKGYRLDWSSQGSRRMMLLQIALQHNRTTIHGLDRIDTDDQESHDAIKDFWDACVVQLAFESEKDSLAAFVKIIEMWKPRSDG